MTTRLVFISDTHNQLHKTNVPLGDILIHCGDFTCDGTEEDIAKFSRDFSALPHAVKIAGAGNHDILFETDPVRARSLLDKSITYLENEEVVVNGIRIYVSPYTPSTGMGRTNAFTKLPRSREISEIWQRIPQGIHVLVTHGPPETVMDLMPDLVHVGCSSLLRHVQNNPPLVHAFGHVHSRYGRLVDEVTGTIYLNNANLDEKGEPTNPPFVIDL